MGILDETPSRSEQVPMLISGKPFRTLWLSPEDRRTVKIIDQNKLPWSFEIADVRTVGEMAVALRDMQVRGAGLIGASAGFGMYLAALESLGKTDFRSHLRECADVLFRTRPTAVNLAWAVQRQMCSLESCESAEEAVETAMRGAIEIADEDAEACRRIGEHGMSLISRMAERKGRGKVINILTHCNAGWLAFVDYGSATAPIYAAHDLGIPVHVWVDETRPRNQGARLTAWELAEHGVPHTVIADNTGGHLMQHGQVDLVITGADRVTRNGDVANKIGTYLKALAAHDNQIPFYVALPSSTLDWSLSDGLTQIPIEQRPGEELSLVEGIDSSGRLTQVQLLPDRSPIANYAFDVTPARLVTGLITEFGICSATTEGIESLFKSERV